MSSDEKTVLMPHPESVAIGTQLSGTYQLDERIASGGMGEVFRGHNIHTKDPVAIKIVLPEFARDATILALFRKEASILKHLAHGAIVRYEIFTIDQGIGRPYLAMEFVDGPSLADMLARQPLSKEDARKLLFRLASGLAAAHEAGIVHRDLSPDNIILPGGAVERAKMIDFGIARSATVGGGETLIGGTFAGKYDFVSPEQLGMAGGEVTERADIYALGLVLCAALLGRPINMGGSQVDVIDKRRGVPDLSGIEPGLRPLLEAMLQPSPDDRPAGMADIARQVAALDASPPDSTEVTDAPPSEPTRILPMPPVTQAAAAPPAEAIKEEPGPPVAISVSPKPNPAWESPGKMSPWDAPREAGQVWGAPVPPQPRPAATPLVAIPSGETPSWLGGSNPPAEAEAPWRIGGATPPPPSARPVQTAAINTTGRGQPPNQPIQRSRRPKVLPLVIGVGAFAILALAGAGTYYSGLFDAVDAPAPVARPAASQPETSGPQQATRPVAKPSEPPPVNSGLKAMSNAADRVAWLRDYPNGPCFYAGATAVSGAAMNMQGLSDSEAPFHRLMADYTAKFGSEANMTVQLIRPAQCVVTEFMSGLRGSSAQAPALSLTDFKLADKQPVTGEVDAPDDMRTYLLLVDDDGVAHNISRFLTPSDGKSGFSVPIMLDSKAKAMSGGVPQLLLAITANGPVAALDGEASAPATSVLPGVLKEFRDKRLKGAATARYFVVEG